MKTEHVLNRGWWMFRITFGVVPIVAGVDKFTNLLVHWEKYLNPMVARMLPISGATFMMIVGVVEILAGLLVLSRWTRIGAYVVSAWLACIALNLISSGAYLDIAVRDVVMAISAYRFAKLTELREQMPVSEREPLRIHKPLAA